MKHGFCFGFTHAPMIVRFCKRFGKSTWPPEVNAVIVEGSGKVDEFGLQD